SPSTRLCTMCHSFMIDGLPVDAVEIMQELRQENPDITFGFVGLEGFEERIGGLSEAQAAEFLGPVATNDDSRNLQIEELRDLVNAVAEATESPAGTGLPIEPVPADKLDANDLPGHWRSLIFGGWQNAHLVASYIDRHPEPLIGEQIARIFNEKYQYLKTQHLSPGTIMTALYEMVVGAGTSSPARQVAAQALLAHLFESCDIFENVSAETMK
ncbi:MAG: ABC-three component system protein, partial [Candidatus Sedimenticola sp. 6PFRAG1]